MAFNQVILVGNIARDIELKTTSGGQSVCSFTVAVKRRFQETTDFHDCVAWGKTAETISNNFHKGKEILVVGELQKRSYEDNSGNKRWVTEVNVSNFSFTGRKDDGGESESQGNGNFRELGPDEDMPFF